MKNFKDILNYLDIIRYSTDGIAVIDQNARVIEWNPAMERITGYAAGDVTGLPMWLVNEMLLGSDLEDYARLEERRRELTEFLYGCDQDGLAGLVERRVVRPDGGIRLVQESRFMIESVQGRLIYGIFRDITELEKAKVAAAESEERYRVLAEQAPDVIITYDDEGRVTYANPCAVSLIGRVREGHAGLPIEELTEGLEVDGAQGREIIERVLESGKTVIRDVTYRLDGEEHYFESSWSPLRDVDGRITSVLCLSREVTELRRTRLELERSEERYRLLTESARDIIMTFDRKGRITYVNAYGRDILEPFSRDLIGHTPDELFAGNMGDIDIEKIMRQVLRGEVYLGETEVRRPDGSPVFISIQVVPMSRADEEESGLLAVVRDMTKERLSEKKSLEAAREYSTLASNIPGIVFRSIFDGDLRIQFFNSMLSTVTGYSEEELSAMFHHGVPSLEPLLTGETRESTMRTLDRAKSDGRPYIIEYAIRTKDGLLKSLREYGRPISDEAGDVRSIDGIILDVTEEVELRQAEERSELRYKVLAGNIPGIVFASPPGGSPGIEFFNGMLPVITGYEPDELPAVAGAARYSIQGILLEDDLSRVIGEIDEAVRRNEPYTVEYRIRHRDGGIRTVREYGRPVADEQGTAVAIHGVILDITEPFLTDDEIIESMAMNGRLFENIDVGVVVYDRELRYRVWNGLVEKITGRKAKDVLGRTAEEVFGTGEAVLRMTAKVRSALSGEVIVDERRGRMGGMQSDGAFRVTCSPIRNEAEEPCGVIAFFEDISG